MLKYIKKEDLIIGACYFIDSRGADVGQWNGEAFDTVRLKFGFEMPQRQYHWDDGAPFGTVKPWRIIE